MSILDMLKENPLIPAIGIGGALLGGIGGAYLGGAGLSSYLLGGLLAVGGLAAGAFAGHKITQYQDQETPAPLGVRTVETAKVEPNKEGEVAFKPSVRMSKALVTSAEQTLTSEPAFKKYSSYTTLLKQGLPYAKFNLKGKGSADGMTMEVSSVVIDVPGMDKMTLAVSGITVPMKDGKFDPNHPDSKAKLQQVMEKCVEQYVPNELREKVRTILRETLDKQTSALPTDGDKQTSLLGDAKDALNSSTAQKLLAGMEKAATGGYGGHGNVPNRPHNPPGIG